MLPHQNNGTLPEAHTELRDARRRQRNRDLTESTRPLPPITDVTQPFRHMPLIAAIGLLMLLALVLFRYVPGVGAAERPVAQAVEIVTVDSDLGRYHATLADGRIVVVTAPAATKTRPSRVLTTGAATLTNSAKQRTLVQGGVSYRVVQLAVAK